VRSWRIAARGMDAEEGSLDSLVAAAEIAVAACSACARATVAWAELAAERSRGYLREGQLEWTAALDEDDEVSSGSTVVGSWSPGSSPRKPSPLSLRSGTGSPPTTPEFGVDRWAKFPAAGLAPSRWRAETEALPDGWLELAAPDGWTTIYVNPALATTSWTRPERQVKPPAPRRYAGRVVNVQSHYAFVRTDPPILVNNRDLASLAKSSKHAKRVGDIFVYRADVDFDLKARQQVTFELAEYKGRVKAVKVCLDQPLHHHVEQQQQQQQHVSPLAALVPPV